MADSADTPVILKKEWIPVSIDLSLYHASP